MDKKKNYYTSRCLEKLVERNRLPMLFVGSGFSKRYLNNSPTWNELLYEIAHAINVTENQMIAMRQSYIASHPHATEGDICKYTGSKLTEIFANKVESGELDLDEIFTKEEISEISRKGIPFVKMLIAKILKNYDLKTGAKYENELKELKKLQETIGAVITTNYDTFLEKEIFNNFTVYSEQSQYYMSDSEGIGEIYKIHGSITSPSTLIFDEHDYENFDKNLRGVASKILSLALDYPIIFLGYSLEDDNIIKILETLVDCLSSSQLEKLSQNIIYVNWTPRQYKLYENKRTINKDGRLLQMTSIDTDNFYVIYKYLQKFMPSERPERVRKYKRMIRELVIKSNAGTPTFVSEQNIDRLNNDNQLVVAFGARDKFAQKGVIGIKIDDMIRDVLEQKQYNADLCKSIGFDAYTSDAGFKKTNFVPVFYYLKKIDKSIWESNEKILFAYKNCLAKVEEIVKNDKIKQFSKEEFDIAFDSITTYLICDVAVKSYALDKMNYQEFIETLNKCVEICGTNDPRFRRAIMYADLKRIE